MISPPRGTLAAIATAGVLTLAACGGASPTSALTSNAPATNASATSASATAPATTGSASSSGASTGTGVSGPVTPAHPESTDPGTAEDPMQHNDADVAFARGMIVHHQGAVAMADLAPGRAADPRILDLAERIRAAQAPEIDVMAGWLEAWGASTPPGGSSAGATDGAGMGGTDHSGMHGDEGTSGGESSSPDAPNGEMPGMHGEMTPEQMRQLTAATGADFDARWLELMIAHHRGAVAMAGTELQSGINPGALDLARVIAASQAGEIGEMELLVGG